MPETRAADATLPARDRGIESHSLPDLQTPDLGAHALHDAGHFMADDDRRPDVEQPVLDHANVGLAERSRLHPDQHLVRAGIWLRGILHSDLTVVGPDDCLHINTPIASLPAEFESLDERDDRPAFRRPLLNLSDAGILHTQQGSELLYGAGPASIG